MASFVTSSSPDDALDVSTQFIPDRYPVLVGPNLRATGWRGGTFVQYANSNQEYTVERSDGNAVAGFLLFQSEDYNIPSPENWGSMQFRPGPGGNNVITMINGGTRAYFRVYETVALSGGTRSGAPITYVLNQTLYVSENGLLCNDDAVEMALAGITNPIAVGIVSAVPSATNQHRLSIDLKY